MTLDDDKARRTAIAGGDFSGVDVGTLTDTERRMLVDAAGEEIPDVSGFALMPGQRLTVWAPYRYVTEQYVTRFATQPTVQTQFLIWQSASGPTLDG